MSTYVAIWVLGKGLHINAGFFKIIQKSGIRMSYTTPAKGFFNSDKSHVLFFLYLSWLSITKLGTKIYKIRWKVYNAFIKFDLLKTVKCASTTTETKFGKLVWFIFESNDICDHTCRARTQT
jgi:hypothetical protein